MFHNPDSFRQAVTAFRNARGVGSKKEQRVYSRSKCHEANYSHTVGTRLACHLELYFILKNRANNTLCIRLSIFSSPGMHIRSPDSPPPSCYPYTTVLSLILPGLTVPVLMQRRIHSSVAFSSPLMYNLHGSSFLSLFLSPVV